MRKFTDKNKLKTSETVPISLPTLKEAAKTRNLIKEKRKSVTNIQTEKSTINSNKKQYRSCLCSQWSRKYINIQNVPLLVASYVLSCTNSYLTISESHQKLRRKNNKKPTQSRSCSVSKWKYIQSPKCLSFSLITLSWFWCRRSLGVSSHAWRL